MCALSCMHAKSRVEAPHQSSEQWPFCSQQPVPFSILPSSNWDSARKGHSCWVVMWWGPCLATRTKWLMILLHGSTLYAGAGERSKQVSKSGQGEDVTWSPEPEYGALPVEKLFRLLVFWWFLTTYGFGNLLIFVTLVTRLLTFFFWQKKRKKRKTKNVKKNMKSTNKINFCKVKVISDWPPMTKKSIYDFQWWLRVSYRPRST